MRTLWIPALACLVFVLAGCGGKARKQILGKWVLADAAKRNDDVSYDFREGGKVITTLKDIKGKRKTDEGKYSLPDEKTLVLEFSFLEGKKLAADLPPDLEKLVPETVKGTLGISFPSEDE